jgi:licheninase
MAKFCTSLIVLAAFAAAASALAAATAPMPFVDRLRTYDKGFWRKSDGWANGWERNDTGWRAQNALVGDGRLVLRLSDTGSDRGASGRRYASGEYQTNAFFGYGRFEARIRAAAGPGLVTGFFTYTGPSFRGDPHHEIDFEFLGKAPRHVQLNYYTDGVGNHETMIDLGFDATQDFHLYAFEWRPDSIRWFVDGALVHEETGARGPLPSVPGKIYLNLWAGKNLDGWLGRFKYPGRPLEAAVDCVAFQPLDSTGSGCDS